MFLLLLWLWLFSPKVDSPKYRTTNQFLFFWHPQPIIQVKGICKGLHPNVYSERSLQHYCLSICLRWTGNSPSWLMEFRNGIAKKNASSRDGLGWWILCVWNHEIVSVLFPPNWVFEFGKDMLRRIESLKFPKSRSRCRFCFTNFQGRTSHVRMWQSKYIYIYVHKHVCVQRGYMKEYEYKKNRPLAYIYIYTYTPMEIEIFYCQSVRLK